MGALMGGTLRTLMGALMGAEQLERFAAAVEADLKSLATGGGKSLAFVQARGGRRL
jgi:hypothetical protein